MARRVTNEEIIEMHRLYRKYGNYTSVAQKIGRSPSTVAHYIKLTATPNIVADIFKENLRNGKR